MYDIAPPRVRRYLDAEVDYIVQKVSPGDVVLELGCGYGRILPALARQAGWVIGIDTSLASLVLGQETLGGVSNCDLLCMDAVQLGFRDSVFDMVVCVQNGISAFHVNQRELIRESIRVTKRGGVVLFSSYSGKFWKNRLRWFELQSKVGLLGEIDYMKTGNGVIVCKDGFTATTVQPDEFVSMTKKLDVETRIVEVDESSLFCEIVRRPEK